MWWRRSSRGQPTPTSSTEGSPFSHCPGILSRCLHNKKLCEGCGFDRRGRDPLLGTQQRGFRILERAKEGLWGPVYLAEETTGERALTAFHLLRPEQLKALGGAKLMRERLRFWSSLRHPGIAPIQDFGEIPQGFYWAIPWIKGRGLSQLMRAYPGGLPESLWFDLMTQILEALELIHRYGGVMAQLRPEHVLLSRRGRRYQVRLLDIGCGPLVWTRPLQSQFKLPPLLHLGAYLPPEQMTTLPAGVQPRSDLYTAGVLMFQMITGRLPFRARNWEELYKKQRYAALPRLQQAGQDIPYHEHLETFFRHAMAKEPMERIASARQFAHQLSTLPLQQARRVLVRTTLAEDNPDHTQKTLDNPPPIEALNAAREEHAPALPKPPIASLPPQTSPRLFSTQLFTSSQFSLSSVTLSTADETQDIQQAIEDIRAAQARKKTALTLLALFAFFGVWWCWLWMFG